MTLEEIKQNINLYYTRYEVAVITPTQYNVLMKALEKAGFIWNSGSPLRAHNPSTSGIFPIFIQLREDNKITYCLRGPDSHLSAHISVSEIEECKEVEGLTFVCHCCGKAFPEEESRFSGEMLCDDCFTRVSGTIKPYSTKPRPQFFGRGRYFGVELEVDKAGEYDYYAHKIISTANKSEERLYVKHDGSLNDGFELVSQPMSLGYHKTSMPWEEVTKAAIELGFKSHDAETCGLHIHVNRASLGNNSLQIETTIAKILYFVELHWNEIFKLSRRFSDQIDEWAPRYGYENYPKQILEKAKALDERHMCINIKPVDTIEFRVFRGTLRAQTILASIELVDAICEFCKFGLEYEVMSTSWSDFVASLDTYKYGELIRYLKKHGLYINRAPRTNYDEI